MVDPVTGERFPDFLETIKRIVLTDWDDSLKRQATAARNASFAEPGKAAEMDIDYGVDRSELVPMPFDAPSVREFAPSTISTLIILQCTLEAS